MLPKPCRRCGRPGAAVCDHCRQAYATEQEARRQRPPRWARGYDTAYDRNRRVMVRRAWAYREPCWRCGHPFAGMRDITADHIVPLRQGGTSELSNLAPCCKRCNYGWNRR